VVTVDTTNAADAAKSVKNGIAAECTGSPVRRSVGIGQLAAALAKAQGELKNPPKDSINPHFKSRYADLATVRDVVMPVLSRCGLSVVQMPCDVNNEPALTTVLMHVSGEWVESTMRTRPTKSDPQGLGSALTYARRYSLQSIVGVAADDDDDGAAGSRPVQQQERPAPPRENPALRAKIAQAFAQANTADEWTRINTNIKRDHDEGLLTDVDLTHLRPIASEAKARIGLTPAVAK
jgi:hypothetical protein